jgi:hypothetical protein
MIRYAYAAAPSVRDNKKVKSSFLLETGATQRDPFFRPHAYQDEQRSSEINLRSLFKGLRDVYRSQ